MALTNKEKAFSEEYVANGGNATRAYLTAYGGTYETANATGWRVLKKPDVKEYIRELQKVAFDNACITAERVALRLADIAFAEKGDEFYNISSQLKALDLLQKQLGLQHQKLEADINTDINIQIIE
ncbi:MAG: terminase small subunit [Clostridia bacterium]|nr:terminase small subunit [Clostridia bacterium]